MSFILARREESSRYKVRVVGTDTKKVNSLTTPASKGKRVVRNVLNKAVSALMIAMFAALALMGTLVSATPAKADFISDGFKTAFCSKGLFNYDLSTKWSGPNTGDHTNVEADITPYEKYGAAGLEYTLWLGPESEEGLDEHGEFGGISIVNFAGGKDANSGIDTWGNESAKPSGDNQSTKNLEGFYNKHQECLPVINWVSTDVANILLMTAGEVVNLTNLVYQTAYEASSNIIIWLEPAVKSVVTALKDAVFLAFLTPVIMISALWMAWIGLVKRQSTQMAQGAIWMIGALVASVGLMANPMWLPNTLNTGVTSISQAGMNAVSTAAISKNTENMCVVGSSGTVPAKIDEKAGNKFITPTNPKTRQIIRQNQCTLWYSLLYTPWVMGQFGVTPNNATEDSNLKRQWKDATGGSYIGGAGNKAVKQLGSDSAAYNAQGLRTSGKVKNVQLGKYTPGDSAQNWALFTLDNSIDYAGNDANNRQQQQYALLNVTASQLHRDDYNNNFKGESSETRITIAGTALLASLGAGIMVVIVSMSIIILDIGLIILVLVSPLFFLIGVHPGTGRRIALGWLETILGLAIKRVVLSMLLSVMLIFYSTVLSESSAMPWPIAMILVIAVSIGGILYKDKLTEMFGKISLGGSNSLGGEIPGSNKFKRMAKNKAKKALGMSTGEFDAKELGEIINNRGAGGRPNEGGGSGSGTTAGAGPTPREAAAQKVLDEQNSEGAGESPHEDSSGAGAAPHEDASGAGETPAVDEAAEEETSGAGERPQHHLDPQGNVVDANGNIVEDSELSAEEKAALGGAGERPVVASTAAERLRDSNPAVIAAREKAEQEREENKRRLLPPVPPTASMQSEAIKYNKALDKEQAKLSKNADAPVSRAEAMESLQQKADSAAQARQIREERKQFIEQKRREILVEPARELREMATSADAAFGNPVKKTVQKAASTAQRAGAKIEVREQQRQARREFEEKVTQQMKQDAREMKQQAKELRERQKSIPKEYRHLDSRV